MLEVTAEPPSVVESQSLEIIVLIINSSGSRTSIRAPVGTEILGCKSNSILFEAVAAKSEVRVKLLVTGIA